MRELARREYVLGVGALGEFCGQREGDVELNLNLPLTHAWRGHFMLPTNHVARKWCRPADGIEVVVMSKI